MNDRLLFQDVRSIPVPIDVILKKVSDATGITIDEMLLPNHYPGSRKREIVTARQISMALTKKYNKYSLSKVGERHGGRDHATVLHSIRTVENLLDCKDQDMVFNYKKAIDLIRSWQNNHPIVRPSLKELLSRQKQIKSALKYLNEEIIECANTREPDKTILVKRWIKNSVPLETREKLMLKRIDKEF